MTETTKGLRFSVVAATIVLSLAACKGPPPPPPPVAAAPPPPPAPPPPAPQRQFVVYFEFDKSDLTPEGSRVVMDAASAYKQAGSARIAVTGHTDLSGTQQYNLGLSQRRADPARGAPGPGGGAWRGLPGGCGGQGNPCVPRAGGGLA